MDVLTYDQNIMNEKLNYFHQSYAQKKQRVTVSISGRTANSLVIEKEEQQEMSEYVLKTFRPVLDW